MLSFDLSPVEARILGSLMEKERVTPENYPLSLHALAAACNQTTNREPVASYSEKTVEDGVNSLRDKKLATVFFGAGARVQKYRHNLPDHLTLERREEALLCVLLLRGSQTPGELRARTERMCAFGSSEEVESCLAELAKGDSALIHCLPARAGQKERRYIELLSRTVDSPEPGAIEKAASPAPSRLDMLEKEVADLKGEFRRLTEAFDAFRKQFD